MGMAFRSRAEKSKNAAKQVTSRPKSVLYTTTSSFFYMLFLMTRAYRGFFVLIPAIFRQVYAKLQATVENDLSLVDDTEEIEPTSGKVTWRTRATVGVLATVVTFSYFLGGLLRVIGSFIQAVTRTKSVTDSFAAAAVEAMRQDSRLERGLSPQQKNGSAGDEAGREDRLTP